MDPKSQFQWAPQFDTNGNDTRRRYLTNVNLWCNKARNSEECVPFLGKNGLFLRLPLFTFDIILKWGFNDGSLKIYMSLALVTTIYVVI